MSERLLDEAPAAAATPTAAGREVELVELAARAHFERENERLADYRFPSWWFAVRATGP